MNGLNVNQATYEEVIGLIKQTPKCHDILLKVNNFGKIPFQEKSGDCIKWLQVMDLIDSSAREQMEAEPALAKDRCIVDYKTTLECGDTMSGNKATLINEQIKLLDSNDSHNINSSGAFICKQQAATTTSLSSDEGIESCESRRAISLSSESENELPQNHNQIATNDRYQEDSAVSSTLTLSNDESCSCSSACSISISSVQTTTTTNSSATSGELEPTEQQQQQQQTTPDSQQKYSILPEDIEVIVKVPGGKQTNEPFGCGVVKGPDEWPGIFVQNVKPGSLAQRVGLQPGDQLTRADGQVLVELTFDTAIGLIKQLQQQQDELLLHVKKGAALKHLSENRQRNQVNQQQQLQFTGTQSQLTTTKTSTIKQQQQEPLTISCGSGNGKGKETDKASKMAQNDSDQENWSFDESSNQMQTPSCESNDRKVFTTGSNEISGTQNQLSDKHWPDTLQQQQQQRRRRQQVTVRSQDEQEKSNSNLSRIRIRSSIGSGNNDSEEGEETDFVMEETKQTTIRIDNGTKRTADHCSSSRLDKSYAIANQASRKSNLGAGDSSESRQTKTKFLVEKQQAKSVVNEMKTKQQQQQVANFCKSHNYYSNGNHTNNNGDKKVKRGCSLDDDSRKISCRYQTKTSNKTRQDCEKNHFENDGGDYCDVRNDDDNVDGDDDNVDEEEDEEIRIVSQNCKLHHQPFHNNFSKSNLIQEKFPPREPEEQLFQNNCGLLETSPASQQAKSRDILTRKFQLNQANKKRQTVDDMRRQLDIKGSSRRPSMHRYVSFENLSSSRLACSLQQQQKHLLRGSPVTRRANAEENRYINDDYIAQSRLQVEQRSLSKQRLYSRSSSVLSQNALQSTCCTQARPSLVDFTSQVGSKTVRCIQMQQQKQERQLGIFPMARQHSQCCLQQAQQQQQHHYGSALDPQFALSRSKARSMDKLNMSMNLSYLNISQNPYKVSRQALVDKAYAGSVISSGQSKSKRERRMLMKNQLVGHSATTTTLGGNTENGSLLCCKLSTLQPLTCLPDSATPTPFYNYSTASRLISTVSGASSTVMPLTQNRMRLLQQAAACCSNLYPDSCSANLCQSPLCSSHHNKLIENQPRRGCYSPNLDLPIYAKCNGKLKNGFVADLNTKIQKTLNNNSYSCCSSSNTSATLSACCPTNSIHSSDLSTVCCLRTEPSLDCLKYEEIPKGATTDSSGYLSSNERYHAPPRLLKMCPVLASPPQPPPPPPPPPKIVSSSGKQQHYNCQPIGQQRDTRQRLTTFLSTASMNNSSSGNKSSNNNNNVNRHLPNSSDVSPTCSSSYSPSTSITSTQSDHSSLSVDRLGSVSPLNNQQTNGISSTTSGCKPIGNQKRTSCSSGKSTCNPCSARTIPCPPPMPAPDKEFERKLNNILRQQDLLDGGQQAKTKACGDESGNNNNKINLLHARKQLQETNENRLCFVDELKLIAKRQQQQSASQVSCSSSLSSISVSLSSGESSANNSTSATFSSSNQPIDSSTLIKIINASKSSTSNAARVKGGFSCQAATNNGLAGRNIRQQQNNNSKCNHKCSATSNDNQENDHQLRCISNIKSSHRKYESSNSKSVKLDDEHNKRRQHGKYYEYLEKSLAERCKLVLSLLCAWEFSTNLLLVVAANML